MLAATGTVTRAPAFTGDVKVVISGMTATVPITSVGGKVYAKLPPDEVHRDRPAGVRRPDPADFADPRVGLSSLLTQLDGLERGSRPAAAAPC